MVPPSRFVERTARSLRRLGQSRLVDRKRASDPQNVPSSEDRASGEPHRENIAGRVQILGRGSGDQLARVDNLPWALKQVKDEAPVILLAHEPDIFVQVPARVTLTLAGHTHGGQVYIPFVGRPVTGSVYGQRFAYGHIVEKNRHLIVSAGLGLSVAPVRFLVPPEITMVTLSGVEA